MSQEEIRAFLAIELPDSVTDFLDSISAQLKKGRADVKWVNPKSIHLTLKFLGNVKRAVIPEFEKVLEPIFSRTDKFQLNISGLGVFPNLRQPRVVWAGVSDPSGQLAKIVPIIDETLVTLGFEKESRSFNPHLTLGRSRSSHGKEQLVELIGQVNCNGPNFIADRAVLFQSLLTPTGARYSVISIFNFSESN